MHVEVQAIDPNDHSKGHWVFVTPKGKPRYHKYGAAIGKPWQTVFTAKEAADIVVAEYAKHKSE